MPMTLPSQGRLGRKLASEFPILSSVIRMAYNQDFTTYVNEALKANNMPADPDMDWAKWLERVYYSKLSHLSEDIRDEAIHYVLVTLLFHRDILKKFDPNRLADSVKSMPLEKQIASYLKSVFILSVDLARRYVKRGYGEEIGFEDFAPEGTTEEAVDRVNDEIRQGHINPEIEQFLGSEITKLRRAFHEWLDDGAKVTPRSAMLLKGLFDTIIVSDGTQADIIKEFAEKQGLSEARIRQILYIEMPKVIRRFSRSSAGSSFSLAKRIPPMLEKEKINAPILEDAPMRDTVTASKNELLAPKESKYAKFRQLAMDEPEALSEALSELSEAFSSLSESAEALVENLDLSPVPAGAGEKTASRKKFASALRRLAAEDPAAVEEALNEIYNAVDEVAAAIENLADNLGFSLSEVEVTEVIEDSVMEDDMIPSEDEEFETSDHDTI